MDATQRPGFFMTTEAVHRVKIDAGSQLRLGGVGGSPCVRHEPAMPLCRLYRCGISVTAHLEVAPGKSGGLPYAVPTLHGMK